MTEVLLVQPQLTAERAYPLGLGAIAAALERAGVRVTGHHDQVQPVSRLLALARSGRFAWIGISSLTRSLPRALELARWLRTGTAAPIVLGGPHVSVRPADGLAEPAVDAVVAGEGEAVAVALTEALARGTGLAGLRGQAGLHLRGRSPAAGDGAARLADLDAWPDARRDLVPATALTAGGLGATGREAPLVTSRGCPFRCTFCPTPALSGATVRRRSPDRIVAEVDGLAAAGVARLLVEDDQLLADREHLFALCDALAARGARLPFSCANGLRPELLDRPAAHALARAGCDHVALGLESAAPATLQRLGRCADLARVRQAVADARAEGLRVSGCFMLGLPGEGPGEWRASLALAAELELEVAHFNVFGPLPGSALAAADPVPEQGPALRALLRTARGAAYLWYHGRPDRALRTLRSTGAGVGSAPAALARLIRWILMRTS